MTGLRRPAAAGLVAAVLAWVTHVWGPPGGDAAAHLYLTGLWSDHGWLMWDNLWYAGRYAQVNYSLVYYPAAALLSAPVVSALAAGAAAWGFGVLVARRWAWAGPWPAWAFALLAPLPVIAGTYPFMLGTAFGVWSLVMLACRRPWAGVALAAATTLASPLALVFVLLGAAAGGVALGRDGLRRRDALVAAGGLTAVLAAQYLCTRAFPSPDARYQFDARDAWAIGALVVAGVALTARNARARDLTAFFALYGAATLGALVVTTPVGGNLVRITLVAGVPLALVAAAAAPRSRAWMSVGVVVVAAALAWQVTPTWTGAPAAWRARASDAAYWQPMRDFLAAHPDPGHRVHVVATRDNWEAYHLASHGVPLTRGWFRQDDFPVNAPLYARPLTGDAYRAWLRDLAVRYVLVPDDPRDAGGDEEARLLAGGLLPRAARLPGWTVYEAADTPPLATPASRVGVVAVTPGRVTLRVDRPGVYRVRMRYSPYLEADNGACVTARAPWGVKLAATRAGIVHIGFRVTPQRVLDTLVGHDTACVRGRGV